eukprot:gb/GECG01005961.1/.p1 GENE.gb/GECG01005961.1/~~gb/GECG01005961.1/.p1  ORF type:complete len:173 (+),score=22.43 gb/GECG01005961.1/:1-519(+)
MQRKGYEGILDAVTEWGIESAESLREELGEAEDVFKEIRKYAPAPDGVHARNYMFIKTGGLSMECPPAMLKGNPQYEDKEGECKGLFKITRIKPGKLYTYDFSRDWEKPSDEVLIINVPEHISSKCKPDWTLEAVLEKDTRNWKIREIWSVYTPLADPTWSPKPIDEYLGKK